MAKKKRDREGEARHPGGTGVGPMELPRWLPWVVFPLLTVLLFAKFVFSNAMLLGQDTVSLGYMARKFYADALRAGDFPLWNPTLLGGTPFVEALSGGDSLYPTALLLLVMEPYRALGWKLVLHVMAAGFFMYGWTRKLGASRPAALVGGIAYLMAPYFVSLVFPGHDGKMFVTALAPLLFWAMESTFTRRGLLAYAAVALVVALVILTTHFQMAYFLFLAAGAYYAFRCVQEARRGAGGEERGSPNWSRAGGAFGIFLAASVVGAAIAGVQLVPALDYIGEFSRRTATTTAADPAANKEYAASWSMHGEEAVALVVPEFVGYGGSGQTIGESDWTRNTYWGRNFFKLNAEYVGLVVLLLAGVSFFGAARRGERLVLAAIGGLSLLYTLGAASPVWQIAYALLPGVRMFRAAGMAIFLFGFAAATLAALGTDRLLALAGGGDGVDGGTVTRFLWIATGVSGAGLVLSASGILISAWTGILYGTLDPSKAASLAADAPFITRGFVIATAFAAATAALAWGALRQGLPRSALLTGLALLVVVDLWRVDAPFIQVMDPARMTVPDPLIAELVKRKETEPPFRVFEFGNDQGVDPAAFGIETAGGHHPNDLQRYRELIGMAGSGMAENIGNANLLQLLNIRYLIWPTAQQGGEPTNIGETVARSMIGDQVYKSLITYPPGFDRARLVGAAEVVPDDAAVARILASDFNPGTTAVLSEEPPIPLPGGFVQGKIDWASRGNDRQELTVESPSNALLVVADNWYPAWKATVDGVETPILRAYHTLRAIPVTPGQHRVVLWYDAGYLRTGLMATGIGLLIVGVVVAFSLVVGRRRDEPTV